MNNFNNNGMPMMGMGMPMMPMQGMMPQQQNFQLPACQNPLGEKKVQELKKMGRGLPSISITEEDMDKAYCNHKLPNGTFDAELLPNGKYKCNICGDEFRIIEDATPDDIVKCTENMHDLLSTAKVMWIDAPSNVLKENFQVMAVLDKVPQIFNIANASLQKIGGTFNMATMSNNPYNNNMSMLNNIMGGQPMYGQPMQPMYGQPQMMQPMYGQPMQPQMMQQPMGNGINVNPYNSMSPMAQQMVAGAPGMAASNGMGYTAPPAAPTPAPAPTTAPAATPAAPANPDAAPKVTQTLTV